MAWFRLGLLFLASVGALASRRCCPDGEQFLAKERHCSDSHAAMALNCSVGKYILNPNRDTGKDHFTILPDDSLLHGHIYQQPDRYCLATLVHRDGTTNKEDVAFVCFPDPKDVFHDDDDDDDDSLKSERHIVIGALLWVSVVFMLAMLLVYCLLPEMRDLEGKCLLSAVLSLCVAYAILAALQFHGSNLTNTICVTSAFSLYFWMLAAFFWLNVVSFNLWKSVFYTSDSSYTDSRLFVNYCLYGWGCPLIFLATALLIHHMLDEFAVRPNFGQSSCWFDGDAETWAYFYGPVAILICCNLVLFVSIAWRLWKYSHDQTAPRLHSMRYKCVLYSKLFVIMGITWVFELLSHIFDKDNKSYFWYATDIVNALQGPLIFLITVVCRKRVLRGLSQHRTLGFNWPKRWAAGVDAESLAILAVDGDVEMAQPCGGEKLLS